MTEQGLDNHAGEVRKSFGWIGDGDGEPKAFTATYSNSTSRKGVIVLPPLGHEYNHSFRALAFLCEQLSFGATVVKLELPGVGNAAGDAIQGEPKASWQNGFTSAVKLLQEQHGVTEIAVVAYRVSGLVAMALAQLQPSVKQLVLWNPYLTGAPFFRDMEMLHSMQQGGANISESQPDKKRFDAGGCVLDKHTQDWLTGLNLKSLTDAHVDEVVFVQPEEQSLSKRFIKGLTESGLATRVFTYQGNKQFQKPALENSVPLEAIRVILAAITESESFSRHYSVALGSRANAGVSLEVLTEGVKESIVEAPGSGLIGVLTQPKQRTTQTLCVLINGGAAHHVGPARLHVNVARYMAGLNIPVLRVDLSALGEGPALTRALSAGINPFPEGYKNDIHSLLQCVKASLGYEQVVLGGLCSAGHNGFNYLTDALKGERLGASLNADDMPKVRALLMINPMHLYWQQGQPYMTFGRHHGGLADAARYFMAALKGQPSSNTLPSYLARVLNSGSRLFSRLVHRVNDSLSLVVTERSTLNADLALLNQNKIDVHLIVSKNEPGKRLFKRALGFGYWWAVFTHRVLISPLPETDHAFSTRANQCYLMNCLLRVCTPYWSDKSS